MQHQITEKCQTVFAQACEIYGIDFDFKQIRIDFTTKGMAAGKAGWVRDAADCPKTYFLSFSLESAEYDINEMLNVVVPHELAHMVNYMVPSTGKRHDIGWKSVCRRLGGTGERTHNQPLTKSVYRKAYLYVTNSGLERVVKSAKKHNNIQRGTSYTIRSSGEKYGRDHFVRTISADEHREMDKVTS